MDEYGMVNVYVQVCVWWWCMVYMCMYSVYGVWCMVWSMCMVWSQSNPRPFDSHHCVGMSKVYSAWCDEDSMHIYKGVGVCVWVYMCMPMYVYHVYVQTCMYCIHVRYQLLLTPSHGLWYIHIYIRITIRLLANNIHVYRNIHTYVCIYTYTCNCTYTKILTYTHTRTNNIHTNATIHNAIHYVAHLKTHTHTHNSIWHKHIHHTHCHTNVRTNIMHTRHINYPCLYTLTHTHTHVLTCVWHRDVICSYH